MNACKHNRSAHWRDTSDTAPVLYHWRGWNCGVIENTTKAARCNARC